MLKPDLKIAEEFFRAEQPDHVSIELFTFPSLCRIDTRRLQLDDNPLRRDDIGAMRSHHDFAAFGWEKLLPSPVPVTLGLIPLVAVSTRLV